MDGVVNTSCIGPTSVEGIRCLSVSRLWNSDCIAMGDLNGFSLDLESALDDLVTVTSPTSPGYRRQYSLGGSAGGCREGGWEGGGK